MRYEVLDCLVEEFGVGWDCWAWIMDTKTKEEFEFQIWEAVMEFEEDLEAIREERPLDMRIEVVLGGKVVFAEEYPEDMRDVVIRKVVRKFGDIIEAVSKECRKLRRLLQDFVVKGW
jgi:hypothetical protein